MLYDEAIMIGHRGKTDENFNIGMVDHDDRGSA